LSESYHAAGPFIAEKKLVLRDAECPLCGCKGDPCADLCERCETELLPYSEDGMSHAAQFRIFEERSAGNASLFCHLSTSETFNSREGIARDSRLCREMDRRAREKAERNIEKWKSEERARRQEKQRLAQEAVWKRKREEDRQRQIRQEQHEYMERERRRCLLAKAAGRIDLIRAQQAQLKHERKERLASSRTERALEVLTTLSLRQRLEQRDQIEAEYVALRKEIDAERRAGADPESLKPKWQILSGLIETLKVYRSLHGVR
jgi:hypothetical protein